MATSGSEEDYQSADEDIDFEEKVTDSRPKVADERKTKTNIENNTCLKVEEKHSTNNKNTVNIISSKMVEESSVSSIAIETISLDEKNSIPQSCTTVSNNNSIEEVSNLKIDDHVTSKVEETISVKNECKEIEENSESGQRLIQKEAEMDAEVHGVEDSPTVTPELVNTSIDADGSNRKTKQTRRQKPREQKPKTTGMKKLGVKIDINSEPSSAQHNLNSKTVSTTETIPSENIVSENKTRGVAEAPRKVQCWEENVNLSKKAETCGFAAAPRKVQCWEENVNFPMKAELQEKAAPLSKNFDEESEPVNELEKIDSVLDRISSHTSNPSGKASWGGWSGWGVSSLLSTATESVSSLTSQVSHGLSSVLETGLGVPNPEDLARMDYEKEIHNDDRVDEDRIHKDERLENSAQKQDEEPGLFGLGLVMTGVSSIGKLVETAGTKVLTGGLDTLETMGKKTMEVLQEGDPGLKKKRAFFTGEKVVLSQVLQEAKERAEYENREKQDKEALRQAHFETLFDDFQGLVHLEALEMLSKKCEMKLEGEMFLMSGEQLVEMQCKVDALKKKCMLPEEDDDDDCIEEFGWKDELLASVKQLEVQDSLEKLIKNWRDVETWLDSDHSELSCREIHIKTMSTLAQLTAEAVKHFHKSAELIAVKTDRNSLREAEIFCCEALHMSRQLRCLAARFSKLLDSFAENNTGSTSVNELITSIYLEASNSSSYIRQAFQLLIPVIQVGVIT